MTHHCPDCGYPRPRPGRCAVCVINGCDFPPNHGNEGQSMSETKAGQPPGPPAERTSIDIAAIKAPEGP